MASTSHPAIATATDRRWMLQALALARRGLGRTSPNPMVGAILVRSGRALGRGWHQGAGLPHAEIEAFRDAARRHQDPRGATLYVTLEPCSTHGRTPPCTEAIVASGVTAVVAGATDPNPLHAGRGFRLLRRAGVTVRHGVLAPEATELNASFNHWIVHQQPWVTVKAALTLDGKIATRTGDSKWITGPHARTVGMQLRAAHDAILVGVNTVIADDPALTVRPIPATGGSGRSATSATAAPRSAAPRSPRRIILDSRARTPLTSQVVSDTDAARTTIVVSRRAPARRVAALRRRARVLVAPSRNGLPSLRWLLHRLGAEGITSLLVEGGGEVNASFLLQGLAHRVAFFYAPKILGGRESKRAVAGDGARRWNDVVRLDDVRIRRVGTDLFLTARALPPGPKTTKKKP